MLSVRLRECHGPLLLRQNCLQTGRGIAASVRQLATGKCIAARLLPPVLGNARQKILWYTVQEKQGKGEISGGLSKKFQTIWAPLPTYVTSCTALGRYKHQYVGLARILPPWRPPHFPSRALPKSPMAVDACDVKLCFAMAWEMVHGVAQFRGSPVQNLMLTCKVPL